MELLEGFVARELLRRVRRGGAEYRGAACASFNGAVLFVDISDYTELAETLCARGASGVDELARTLDEAFRRDVSAIQRLSGEIACFAGDALIAYWPASNGDLGRAVDRARACAGLLHDESHALGAVRDRSVPPLHIGISAGRMWAAHLGADERWHLLLAGPAVREACQAAARSRAGHTTLASAASALADTSGDAHEPTAIEPASDRGESPIDVDALIPKRVQEFVTEGYADWLPQRRSICALFVRIDGLDEEASDALARHQDMVLAMHAAVRPYTGAAGVLLLDDKGLVFTLCLGMPHDAHADDARRAVRAGLAVREALTMQGLDCAVGVADGIGVCLPLGGAQRRQFWPVGRFMHVAGRLMQAAGSGVLCTEDVAGRVRETMLLAPESALSLKGLPQPLHPRRVLGCRQIDDRHGVLYGRLDEQRTVDRVLDTFQTGHGGVVWIVGDAGLGKTTLIQYVIRAAEQRGIQCRVSGSGSLEIPIAYAAWRPIFAAVLDSAPTDAADDRARALSLGDIRHPQLAPLINAVVPGYLDETPLVRSLSGQARADATITLLSDVLAARTHRRFVLVLEDCHWMDSASWRLVSRVAQDCPQALIVLTSRPTLDVEELRGLSQLPSFTEMTLSRLTASDIESIIRDVLVAPEIPRRCIDAIAARSLGNPLFAREYALLLGSGAQTSEADAAAALTSEAQSDADVPITVQSLIASRLDALSPSEDLTLKAASVLGDRFGRQPVASVSTLRESTQAIDSALASLAARQLIVRDRSDDEAYAFQHAVIREVAYAQLTREQRTDLHRRAAETFEREFSSDLRPHYAVLAHHWGRAEVAAPTIKYSDLAATQALAAGAFEEADRLLSGCIRLASSSTAAVSDVDAPLRWHRQLADARHGLGQLASRSAAAHDALRVAHRWRPRNRVALAGQAGARLGTMLVRRIAPRGRADTSTRLDIARAYRHSAEVCYFNNDMLGMICDLVGAVSWASSAPPSAVLAGASTELGGILSVAGLRTIGERILRRAISLAEAAGDQTAQAYAHMISCLYYVGVGEWVEAERSAERCQRLCAPMDDRVNWTNAQAVRFWMSHYRSRTAEALDAANALRVRANETGNRQHRAWASRFLALCALRANSPQEAADHLRNSLDCLGSITALNERLPTLAILALAEQMDGRIDAARETARQGLALVARVGRPIGHSTLEGYSALVTVALDAWRDTRSAEWKQAARTCLGVLGRYRKGFPVGSARFYLHQGDYLRLSGAQRAAERSYRRGEQSAADLGMPWDRLRCREALAATSA